MTPKEVEAHTHTKDQGRDVVLREFTCRLPRGGKKSRDMGNVHKPAQEHTTSDTCTFAHTSSLLVCILCVSIVPVAPKD